MPEVKITVVKAERELLTAHGNEIVLYERDNAEILRSLKVRIIT